MNKLQMNYWVMGGFENSLPVPDALREVKSMGLDGLELCLGDGHFSLNITEKECASHRNEAEKLALVMETVAAGAYWGQPLSHPDPEAREKAVAYTKKYLQIAAWLGAKTVLVIPGAVAVPWDAAQPVVKYADVWRNSTESLWKVLPLAEKLGITIGLENVYNWFLADPVAMREFIDQFRSPFIGSYFDTGNCMINGYPEHWIDILGHRIAAVHLKNFKRSDCGGGLSGFADDLENGDIDFASVKQALRNINYRGAITAEMIPFSRLPNLNIPDMPLARDTATKLKKLMR